MDNPGLGSDAHEETHRETSNGITKCPLFSQATLNLQQFQGLTFRKKSWGHLTSKFSFLVARTSILVAKNYLQEKIEYNTLKVWTLIQGGRRREHKAKFPLISLVMLSYIKLFKGPQFTALDYFNFTQRNSGMAMESLISIIQACLCWKS